jgi:hypothetical protein
MPRAMSRSVWSAAMSPDLYTVYLSPRHETSAEVNRSDV